MCKDGFEGEFCQHHQCLNNCSWPNGFCNHDTGECSCNTLSSPYYRRITWSKWQGRDCSYLPVFSGSILNLAYFAICILAVATAIMANM
jgi:hypothetical protein